MSLFDPGSLGSWTTIPVDVGFVSRPAQMKEHAVFYGTHALSRYQLPLADGNAPKQGFHYDHES